MIQHGVDGKSVGLCMASVFLKIMSEMSMNDLATISATLAAITTVAYNIQKMWKEGRKK